MINCTIGRPFPLKHSIDAEELMSLIRLISCQSFSILRQCSSSNRDISEVCAGKNHLEEGFNTFTSLNHFKKKKNKSSTWAVYQQCHCYLLIDQKFANLDLKTAGVNKAKGKGHVI